MNSYKQIQTSKLKVQLAKLIQLETKSTSHNNKIQQNTQKLRFTGSYYDEK